MTQVKIQLTQTKENRKNMSVRKRIRKRTRNSGVSDSQTGRQRCGIGVGRPKRNKKKTENPPTGGPSCEYARSYIVMRDEW